MNTYTIDGLTITAATGTSWWLMAFNDALSVFLGVGVAVLVVFRIMLAVREWRRGRQRPGA